MTKNNNTDVEALRKVLDALVGLDEDTQARIISTVSAFLGIGAQIASVPNPTVEQDVEDKADSDATENDPAPQDFGEFADLYNASHPRLDRDKALVAGYWIQVCQGADNFSGQKINAELKHLGHKVDNITKALSSLINVKPSLVLQVRKSGTSKQARKTYKLSAEGIKQVKGMISAE